MPDRLNDKHDAVSYDWNSYKREISNYFVNGEALFKAYHKAIAGSKWKKSVQKYGMDELVNLANLQKRLETGTYKTGQRSSFIKNERGKMRLIYGNKVDDRIVRHVLCDDILNPALDRYLIYDNGASQKNKGIAFTRRRLEAHLHKYYRKCGNKGYILLIDFSKYYDNIHHGIAYKQIHNHVSNDFAMYLLVDALNGMRVDVSYMSNKEYSNCMNEKFNSLDYSQIPKSLKTGERFMPKSISIGDQTSQTIGVYYPTPIDNYVKIVRSQKFYGRYMDDSYIISNDKEELGDLLGGIKEECLELGIFLNEKKTQICKIDRPFHFLQNSYYLTETGKVVVKINKKRLIAMRRKLRRLKSLMENGEVEYADIEQMYRSWFGGYYKIMSRKQRQNLNDLYDELFITPYAYGGCHG